MLTAVLRMTVPALLLLASPGQAKWYRSETPAFIVYGRLSEQQVAVASASLAGFDALLRQITGVDDTAPRARVTVYLVDSPTDFDRLLGGAMGVSGFYTATPNTIAAVVDQTDGAPDPLAGGALFHEYAHHFMFARQPGSYPAWYIEGLASYWETARFSKRKAHYGAYDDGRAQTLILANWMPMARVLGTDWASLPGYEMPMFYAQSWLAVHYLSSDPARAAGLTRYLAAVAAGTTAATAFAQTFGYPIERFDKVLIDYVMRGSPGPTEVAFEMPEQLTRVVPLSPVADALLIPAAQLDIGVAASQAPALLDRIRRTAARYPDEISAQIVLATAEIRLGDRAKGRAMVESLLAATPDNATLLMLLGSAQLADHLPAAATFARADAARPDDYRILYLRALALPFDAGAERRQLLRRANQLAPQVDVIALAAAQAEAEAGDFGAARALLTPVANNPHGGAAAERARAAIANLPAAPGVDGAIKAVPAK